MNRKLAAATVVVSMLGGAGAGVALTLPSAATAQTSSTSSDSSSGTAAAAPRQVPQFVTDALKKLVDAGTINQSQADAVSAALAEAQPPRGPGGPGGPGHHGDRAADLAVAAKAIGISEADLKAALESGKSMADVARANNVDPQKVIDAIVADKQAKLDEKVKSGELTQAQADEKKANMVQRVTDMVNGVRPAGGPGHGPRPDGPPPADAPAPAPTTDAAPAA